MSVVSFIVKLFVLLFNKLDRRMHPVVAVEKRDQAAAHENHCENVCVFLFEW